MSTLHLVKAYCLPALLYGVETWSLNNTGMHKASVAWNNSFGHIFRSCWRESVKPNVAIFLPKAAHVLLNRSASDAFLAEDDA